MPGFFLTAGSTIQCMHGGTANVMPVNTKVKADGSPVLVESDVHLVAGCPFNIAGVPSPCVMITWSLGASKVSINGQPALVQTSIGQCKAATGAIQGVAIISNTQGKAQGL